MAVGSGTRNHHSHNQSNRRNTGERQTVWFRVIARCAATKQARPRCARATGPRSLRSIHNENNAGPNQQLWRVHPIALLLPGRPSVAKRRTVGPTLEKLPRVATQAALDLRATRLPILFFNDIVPMAECRKMTTTRGDATC